jgi:hypothetical protein
MKKISGEFLSDVFAKEANVLVNDYGVKLTIYNVNSDYDELCEEITIEGVLTVNYKQYLKQKLYDYDDGSVKISFGDLLREINLFNDTGIYEISEIDLWPNNYDRKIEDHGQSKMFDDIYYDPFSGGIEFCITLYKI